MFLPLFLTVLFEMCNFLEVQQKEYKTQHEFLYSHIWIENLTSDNNFLDRSGLFFFKQQPPMTRR